MEIRENQQDPVFQEEQEHLRNTYQQLCVMEEKLSERMLEMTEKVPEEKREIRENLSLNFGSDTDTMETLIEFEVMNHVIDHYNIESDSVREKLTRVRQLMKAPYFARIRLQFEPDEEPEDYYIGSAEISENGYEHLVLDWRSPIAETYYNQESGKTSYEVNGHRIEADLKLRRQFDLKEDKLNAYFDTQIAIEDPMLLKALSKSRSDKMQSITVTIQKEQNAIIRYPDAPVLLVNGIAGSGKTSVLLQRIAYLFYRQRKNLQPQDVWLMTLNPVFRQYIDNVLPDMGEMNPNTLTWEEFLEIAGVPKKYIHQNPDKAVLKEEATADTLRKIEEELPKIRLEESDLRPVFQKNTRVLSPGQIRKVLARYEHIPTGMRLIQVAIDDLREIARAAIRRIEHSRAEEGTAAMDDSAGARTAAGEEKRIENQYGGAFQAINRVSWINIDAIAQRLIGREPTAAEWLYLKMALTGVCERNARYVCIDEVQDYTQAQLMVLRRYFINAKFMMLGDEFQSIRRGTASFAQIHEIFSQNMPGNGAVNAANNTVLSSTARGAVNAANNTGRSSSARGAGAANSANGTGRSPAAVVELPLMTSYRSTPEITALFTALLPDDRRIQVNSVQHEGQKPVIMACEDRESYIECLTEQLQNTAKDSLTAVICKDRRSLDRIASILYSAGASIPVVHKNEALPEEGVFLIELALSKGLEFDHVILPDADAEEYPDDLISRHRLYTAISRATSTLTVLAEGELTPLL